MSKEKNDDDWVADFGGAIPDADNGDQWAYNTLDAAKKAAGGNINRIWTVVSGDGPRDTEWACAGIRFVNSTYYLVSVEEWTDDDLNTEYLWYEWESEDE